MSNEIEFRIGNDLHCYERPKDVPMSVYSDQMVYGAMSEWIRAITLDVDPLLGNSKTGVTRPYLEDRASSVLIDLAKLVLGVNVTQSQTATCVHWMVSAMIEIGELWVPYPGHVACVPNSVVSYVDRHARIKGLRERDHDLVQIGLCHFDAAQSEPDHVAEFERNRLEAERLLLKIDPSVNTVNGYNFEQNIQHLNDICHVVETEDYIVIAVDNSIDDLPRASRQFLLMHAWPASLSQLNWASCQRWLIPHKI